MDWTQRHLEGRGARSGDPRALGDRSGLKTLGLVIRPNKRFMGAAAAGDDPSQLHSPTVPMDLFFDDGPAPSDTATATLLGTATSASSMSSGTATTATPQSGAARGPAGARAHGSYTLNPDFLRAQDAKTPPVPQLPPLFAGSLPAYAEAPRRPSKPISFPRPAGDDGATATATAPATLHSDAHGRAARQASSREQLAHAKRNHSLPSTLGPAPGPPRLAAYEFTSIESLERKWASVKTESTRMLSSAIYKYYFSHGEWTEFEQVFPSKVLEAWESFQSRLTPSELGFINTVLVSQNPFTGEQGSQKHIIPILARTIPLAQVARTMVFADDMHSRESYSSQSSNGPEIDSEFADWLITRFNAKRPGTALSPSMAVFDDGRKPATGVDKAGAATEKPSVGRPSAERPATEKPATKRPATERPATEKPAAAKPIAEQRPAAPEPPRNAEPPRDAEHSPLVREQFVHEPVVHGGVRRGLGKKRSQQFPQQQQQQQPPPPPPPPPHLSLGIPGTAPAAFQRPKSAMTVVGNMSMASMASVATTTSTAGDEKPKTRRKFTFGSRSELRAEAPQTPRRPSITFPAILQSWRRGSSSRGDDASGVNLPPSPPPQPTSAAQAERPSTASSTASRTRRHTHNFFSSRPVEVRTPTDPAQSPSRPTPRELQMKDLPPLPPNAAEITQLAQMLMADAQLKSTQSALALRKGPGVLAHFSSHSELGQRMAAALDKPRAASLTTDHPEKGHKWPPAGPDAAAAAAALGASRLRESVSVEIARAAYDWRPVPPNGDASWGFSISPLALCKPMERTKSKASHLVVNSHTPTMNRRNLPPPSDPKPAAPARRPPRERQPAEPAKTPAETADKQQATAAPAEPEAAAAKPEQPRDGGSSSSSSTVQPAPAAANGVRGVLYELAYLSTQGKNVWSKSDHIFAQMAETGLEVNRIAEQDFFDYCVDELLKASNDAWQDLQAMGNKKMAKKLYESFNTKLSILLADSAL
ncbi:hypothetical protein H4R18_004904 [Coemansia javaensis]|uniref:Uncharacterized protein n=1 Tax=Coemansia javaensis TaxID=2761396 RepID=A0A9W8H831_9FUNG|nr:hypothetical protein H4R18_004904 [Coemansia javaensis]